MRALRLALALAVLVVAALFARPAAASGRIALSVRGGGSGPVVLDPARGGFVGELEVRNVGDAPLAVSRVAVRGEGGDVRSPSHVSARFDDGTAVATIAPGEARTVVVAWMPERGARVRQALGHVVVTSSDEAAGEVAMGFRADVPAPAPLFSRHLLSWLVFFPLAAAGVALFLHGRRARLFSLSAMAVHLAFALGSLAAFVPDLGRDAGNDGFQLVERAVWIRAIGAEYFVGVDGASVDMLLLVALVGVGGAIASACEERGSFFAALFLFVGAATGVFVALDLLLFFVFWALLLAAAIVLVAPTGGARKLAAIALPGAALLLFAVVLLHARSDPTFLVDGARAPHTFALPELMRVAFATEPAVFGAPFAHVVFVALVVAFAVVTPVFPLHAWLPGAYARAPAATGAALVAVLLRVGPYAVLRVAASVLPESMQWASGAVAAFGAVSIAWGALCATAERDLKRMIAFGAMSQSGFALVGLGALTPQGIAGCLAQGFAQGVAFALLTYAAEALASRARTCDIGALGGALRAAPRLGTVLVLALLASFGMPLLAGFWGVLLVLVGAFPLHPVLTAIAAAAVVLHAASAVWAAHRIAAGEPSERVRGVADLHARDLAAVAPFVAATVLLGVWPAPFFGTTAAAVRDLSQRIATREDPLK